MCVCAVLCVSVVLPGCSYNGGVEASIAGQSHSNGDGPAHHSKSVVCECLKSETQAGLVQLQFQLIHMHLVLHLISFVFVYSEFTHHCHCITGQYGTDIQNSIVGQVGEDVDDGDNGHRDGDGQGQVPETTGLYQANSRILG